MATSGDGRARGTKRPFQSEINEEPQNVPREAGQNNLTGVAELSTHQGGNSGSIVATNVISELEQIMKQNTFTRYETQHLIALLHSRTIEESPSDNFPAAISSSRVLEEEIASPAELVKGYKGSITVGTAQALRQDLKLVNNNATCFPKTLMTSPQHPATMEDLPDELLTNIFVRLLAKQLGQMRSVSKSWNSLLSQSSFVKSHLHHSIHNKDQILLHFSDIGSRQIKELHCRSPHLQDQITNFIKRPVNPQSPHTGSIVAIGSVNGLICSSYNDHSVIHIWNPSLSAVLTLPPYSTPSRNYKSIHNYLRFGFDPKTDDYKVVKLTGIGVAMFDTEYWLQVEIYSMRKGSWELITNRFPSHVAEILDGDVVCTDGRYGHLHWICESGDPRIVEVIVAFDLSSETFREIPLPQSILDHKGDIILGVLAGKLCVMSWGDGTCGMWVMEKYQVAKSWVKHHVFSPFRDDAYPFGFTSRNDFVIQDHHNRLVLHPIRKHAKILDYDCSYEKYVDKFVEYVDSLVWVEPAKSEMVDGAQQI